MTWSRLVTVRTGAVSAVQRQARLLSISASCAKEDPISSSGPASWMTAALAASGVGSIALATTFCEEQPQEGSISKNIQRFHSKDGLKDPMTTYARFAMERELKREEVDKMKPHPESVGAALAPIAVAAPASVQATSAADAPNDTPTIDSPPSDPSASTSPVDMSAVTRGDQEMTLLEARIEEATRKAKQHSGGLKVFSGNGNMSLALEIARHLGVNLGKATVGKFADGEVNVVIHENVRGKDCYVVQPTGPPVNDNLMELLLMVSTLRRSSARRITVVIPYYGYARQDRKMQVRSYRQHSIQQCRLPILTFVFRSLAK